MDLERINDISTSLKMAIIDDYRMRESSRVVNLAKTVYDIEKDSPHYKNNREYIDPESQVRITKATANGRPLENPKNTVKNRYFKNLNPWYVPYSCSALRNKNRPESLADEDDVLLFESRFESGNLKKAIQIDKAMRSMKSIRKISEI